jgi:hypothetical protein
MVVYKDNDDDQGRLMTPRRPRAWNPRVLLEGTAGLATGVAAGLVLLALSGVALAHRLSPADDVDPGALIEAAHVPPLLIAGERPVELRYDIYCAPPGPDPESGAPCDAGGSVYVRAGDSGLFRTIPLELDEGAAQGRYVARVPEEIASSPSGFTYYARLRNQESGAETVLPPGGAAAPQRSLPMGSSVTVSLGAHVFGFVRKADARAASAAWGGGVDQAGLEDGPQATPIGASAFDVAASGAIVVLDEAKKRLLRFEPGARKPQAVPVAVNGTLADLVVASNGSVYVLETAGQGQSETPLIRSFDSKGRSLGSWHTAERTAAALRMGPVGPVTLEYPSGQWMPAAVDGDALQPTTQREQGRAGEPVAGGGDVIVLRTGNEVRVALAGTGGVRASWRIQSLTPLAEVQLAEPLGSRLVVVLRVYTDARDEFVALVLGAKGIVKQFSLDSADWAETAPLSRFRLAGSSLYQLGSTSSGMFVDRFELGVS